MTNESTQQIATTYTQDSQTNTSSPTRDRSRTKKSAEKHDESDSIAPTKTTCDECGGDLHPEETEMICEDCGLVVEVNNIDPGKEWRLFTSDDMDSKPRTGAPRSELLHDHGLSTEISWQDSDAYGQSLSQNQRHRAQRLRKWQTYTQTSDSKERNLKHAFGEISRMASALGIPKSIREVAGVTYRAAVDEDLLPGRSVEGMSTAALYYACREGGSPRTLTQITRVSRVDRDEIASAYRYMIRELDLLAEPPDPSNFVGTVASALDVSNGVRRYAENILDEVKENSVAYCGKHPKGLAGASIYTANTVLGNPEDLTQKKIAKASDVCTVTIRCHHKDVLEGHVDTAEVPDGVTLPTDKILTDDVEIDGYELYNRTDSATFSMRDNTLLIDPNTDTTQTAVMIDFLNMMNEEFDLYDRLSLPFKLEKCENQLIVENPSDAPEQSATWNKIDGDVYVTSKPTKAQKKEYFTHIGSMFGFDVEFGDAWTDTDE